VAVAVDDAGRGVWRLMRFQGIAPFMFAVGSILLAMVAVALSAVFLLRLEHFEDLRRRTARPRSAFLKKLLRGLAKRRIRDLGDVHNSYRAFFGVDTLRGSHLEEVGEFLRQAMARTSSATEELPDGRPGTHSLRELLVMNQRALEAELMCVPFSGTPDPERRILEELLEMAEGDKTKAAARLNVLAKAIRIRQDALGRLGQESSRCLRWAWMGWYGTLVFAVLSAVLGIMYLGW
jgi:hypothetical protein